MKKGFVLSIIISISAVLLLMGGCGNNASDTNTAEVQISPAADRYPSGPGTFCTASEPGLR